MQLVRLLFEILIKLGIYAVPGIGAVACLTLQGWLWTKLFAQALRWGRVYVEFCEYLWQRKEFRAWLKKNCHQVAK